MASSSWPSINHNSGAVDQAELAQWAHPFSADGLVGTPSDPDLVFADSSGLQVKWRANRFGVVRGRIWSSGGSTITTGVDPNSSGQTRVDTAVLRLTRSGVDPGETWLVTEEIVAGTPGAGPPALTLDEGTTGKWELPVADITVANGAATLAAGTVTPRAWYLGEPLVVCTSSTRPPHKPGRRIWETNTGREYVSTGVAWTQTYPVAVDAPTTTNVAPASGWSVSGGQFARLRRSGDIAVLELVMSRTGAALGGNTESTMLTIPSGSRPPDLVWVSMWSSGSEAMLLKLEAGGALRTFGHNGLATGQQVAGTATWVVA